MISLYLNILEKIERFALPLILLYIRVWMARIFWYSGLTKISNWEATISLFKYEYKVPIIQPELAAVAASAVELSCPVLLILGVATRLATLPMLFMTAVIHLTYSDSIEHIYWAMLLALIFCYGPGRISLDYWIKRKNS